MKIMNYKLFLHCSVLNLFLFRGDFGFIKRCIPTNDYKINMLRV